MRLCVKISIAVVVLYRKFVVTLVFASGSASCLLFAKRKMFVKPFFIFPLKTLLLTEICVVIGSINSIPIFPLNLI